MEHNGTDSHNVIHPTSRPSRPPWCTFASPGTHLGHGEGVGGDGTQGGIHPVPTPLQVVLWSCTGFTRRSLLNVEVLCLTTWTMVTVHPPQHTSSYFAFKTCGHPATQMELEDPIWDELASKPSYSNVDSPRKWKTGCTGKPMTCATNDVRHKWIQMTCATQWQIIV